MSYTYDANSNLGQLTDGISGRVNRYSYDFLDRLMRYEESGDGYSNIVQWGYDDENNLSSQTQTLNGSTYASTYAYDKDNRLTKATEGADLRQLHLRQLQPHDGADRQKRSPSYHKMPHI